MSDGPENINEQGNEKNILSFHSADNEPTAWIGIGPIKFNGIEIGYCDGEKITWNKK